MRRSRLAVVAAVLVVGAVALAVGCGKGNKSTNPAVGPLEMSSGNIAPGGGTFAHRFATAGAYPYHCSIHPMMTGIVVVTGSAPAGDSLQGVDITNFNFSVATVTIPIRGKVTWTNITGATTHTVTSD